MFIPIFVVHLYQIFMFSFFKSRGKSHDAYTIAFYNLENLFDTKDNPRTLDDDFTPEGRKNWDGHRYWKKLKKIARVISQIGTERSFHTPAILGVVEVENRQVLKDLVLSKELKKCDYRIVHYDSPDERGIDVGLLYKKELFELMYSKSYPLMLEDEKGIRDTTRDILLVKGKLNDELIYVLVNHWPSRRSGVEATDEKRISAAKLVHEIIEEIYSETENAKIIVMGDFNDDPTSNSVKNYLMTDDFYNPMERLLSRGKGSLNHDGTWYLFDQIIVSKTFFNEETGGHSFKYAEVFDSFFLRKWRGKHKGNPFRTFSGKWYLGGFSDHFPVFIYLKKH
jgi:predicted extracellular nuclease